MLTAYKQMRTFFPGGYSLSIRGYSEKRGHHVKHMKINKLDSGDHFFSTLQHAACPNLISLIAHYRGKLSEERDQVFNSPLLLQQL